MTEVMAVFLRLNRWVVQLEVLKMYDWIVVSPKLPQVELQSQVIAISWGLSAAVFLNSERLVKDILYVRYYAY